MRKSDFTDDQMKITYFSYLYDIHGISLGAKIKGVELMSELQRCGHDVSIHWLNKSAELKNGATTAKTETRRFLKEKLSRYLHEPSQILTNAGYLRKENRIIAERSPDLMIARLDAYLFSSLLNSKIKNIPLLIELDNPVVYEFRKFQPHYFSTSAVLKFFERMNLTGSSFAFTVTEEIKNHYVQQGVPAEKIRVISNGANTERFHPDIDKQKVVERYGLHESVVVGFVGTFHYWHGIENLKKLITRTTALGRNIRFLMVGSGGPMQDGLNRFIQSQNLQDRVILTGFVPHEDIPKYIAAMDIVLAPYPELEFFYYSPLKIFEYMSCGKPVVSTRLGQIADIIQDERNSLLCKPNDMDDMFDKISTLIANAGLRKKMGEEARRSIVEKHSWRAKAEELSSLCEEAIKIKAK